MFSKSLSFSTPLLLGQLGLTILLLLFLLFSPPARGTMMLVPLGQAARADMLPLAVAHGARLVAPGRLPGSFIVYGERAQLARAMMLNGVMMLNAPATGCGDLSGGARNVSA